MKYLQVMSGGAFGSLARYVAGAIITARFGSRFPVGTLVINVSGSFVIGLLLTLFLERYSGGFDWRPLVVTGFLGGYTTFSSFEWETYFAARSGAPWLGALYVMSSVGLGYVAVWLGALLARK